MNIELDDDDEYGTDEDDDSEYGTDDEYGT